MTASADSSRSVSNSVIAERVALVLSHLVELTKEFADFKDCHNKFIIDYTRSHALLQEKANAAHSRIDTVKDDLTSRWKEVDAMRAELGVMKDQLAEMRHTTKQITWFSGIVGSSVIVWLASQILGLL